MTDPKHIDAVAQFMPTPHGIHARCAARDLLDSTDPAVHAAMLDALTRHGVLREPDPETKWTVHVDVPPEATDAEVEALTEHIAVAAYDMERGQWDALVWSHALDCAGSDHCCGPRPDGPPYPKPETQP